MEFMAATNVDELKTWIANKGRAAELKCELGDVLACLDRLQVLNDRAAEGLTFTTK